MTPDATIGVEEVTSCFLCKGPGAELHAPQPDRLFGAPGRWGFMRCPQCGLVWLRPRPIPADIHKAYTSYFTHDEVQSRSRLSAWLEKTESALCAANPGYGALADGWGWKLLGKVLSWLPPFKEIGTLGTMCLNGARKGKLLDVGCGNGRFLAKMREASWEVEGVETDPEAAKYARERLRISVHTGTLENAGFAGESFDAVTLHHVIEHVYDPCGLLRECWRVLKPGGRLVAITPNNQSLGHRLFQHCWRGLEPPRHLFIFSLDTLRSCCQQAGLQVDVLRTSARAARYIWMVSHTVRQEGVFQPSAVTWSSRFGGLVFRVREELALLTSNASGEELVLIGSRKA